MQVIVSLCSIHSNGDAAHNNDFAFSILIDFEKDVLKVVDKVDSSDMSGCVEI